MHEQAVSERFFAIYPVPELPIELHILGKELVGVAPRFPMPERCRQLLGVGHQITAVTASLECG